MISNYLVAVAELDVDPESMNAANVIGIATFIILGIITLLVIARYTMPVAYKALRTHRKSKYESTNAIWFDSKEAQLHRGNKHVRFEYNSFEFFVCELVLAKPYDYQTDTEINNLKDESKETGRGVEQAVRRVNAKTKDELGLEENLFKRRSSSTSVNDMYRKHIKQL